MLEEWSTGSELPGTTHLGLLAARRPNWQYAEVETYMGVKFGEIDADQILENEYRVGVLEQLVDWMLNNGTFKRNLAPDELRKMRQSVVDRLQKKYPNSGIVLREG